MTKVRFLFDENLSGDLPDHLVEQEPLIEAMQPGRDEEAPPKGTSDPDLLRFAEREKLAIVTFDKSTMPDHWANHLAAGGHCWGLFILRGAHSLKAFADELMMIWHASVADEWLDVLDYLPLRSMKLKA